MGENVSRAESTGRVRLQVTVHPRTDVRMHALCDRFATSKGRLIDKLVECLDASYSSGKQYCITGRPCKIELTDLPAVF
jgi:hypothetical protein